MSDSGHQHPGQPSPVETHSSPDYIVTTPSGGSVASSKRLETSGHVPSKIIEADSVASDNGLKENEIDLKSITAAWLAAMRDDFLQLEGIMNETQQISLDFAEWVEAGTYDSMIDQEKSLRENITAVDRLETEAAEEQRQMEFAISEMAKLNNRLSFSSLKKN